MKRLVWIAGLSILFSAIAYAQRFGGGMRGGGFGGARISSGFSGGHIGIGRGFPGVRHGFSSFRGWHGGVRSRIRPGFGVGIGGRGGFHRFDRFGAYGFGGRVFLGSGYGSYPFYPYGLYTPSYPLFYGGYYAAAPAYPAAPNVTVIYLPPYEPEPEERYERREREVRREVTPEVREYGGTPDELPTRREQITFEIATNTGAVYSALAYWVEGNTVQFIDISGKRNGLPLTAIDRARSEELNRSKKVEFRLPPER